MNLNGSPTTRNIVSINTSAHAYEIFVLLYILEHTRIFSSYVYKQVHMPSNRAALEFIHRIYLLGVEQQYRWILEWKDVQQVLFYSLIKCCVLGTQFSN